MIGNPEVQFRVAGAIGLITLNRPKALNALSLPMVRALMAMLQEWRDDPNVIAVAICGSNKRGAPGTLQALFGSFCAGGDIRFFHEAALAGDPQLGEFFTQEYTLNYLIQTYPKPYLAFLDGVVMGGGMGLCQGTRLRIVTESTKMAMPETGIGLFPDVGGGYFLSRCPGHSGEYLALTGQTIGAQQAIAAGLADVQVPSAALVALWESLPSCDSVAELDHWIASTVQPLQVHCAPATRFLSADIDAAFGLPTVSAIVTALETLDTEASNAAVATMRQRSPLMLHVVLEQIRRARTMSLADDLRMERDMVEHCFKTVHLGRSGKSSETVEGIRALAVDKDFQPNWNPARIEDVTPAMVAPFFNSPWLAQDHPLKDLGQR